MSDEMETRNDAAVEVRRIRRLLKEMSKLADHSSLTGSLSDGAGEAVNVYNGILRRLTELGVAPGPLFPELPAEADFDRVGVASRLLSGYVSEDLEENGHRNGHPPNIVIGSLGNLGDMEKLRDLGQNLRDNLAELIRGKGTHEGDRSRVTSRIESSLRRAEAAIAEAEAAVAESRAAEASAEAAAHHPAHQS